MKASFSKDEIVTRLKNILPSLLKDTPASLAYLYGSVALDQATPLSDVDVALILEDHGLTPLEILHLQLQLSVRLTMEANIPDPDVRVINNAPLAIRGQVACQGIPVYVRDEATRIAFETRTRDEFFDYQPIAERLRAAYLADLRERGLRAQSRQD